MEQCHFCGNKNFRDTKCQYTYQRDGKFLMVDQAPCRQCEYCGERYFAAEVLKKIEQEFEAIHLHGKKPHGELIIPLQPFKEIQKAA
jgi:YgiT-type zinc finger domain-containing protein